MSTSQVFPEAKYFVSKDHCHNYFDASLPPVLTIEPGDLVHVETNDCFHGRVHSQLSDPNRVAMSLPVEQLNPVTGPIYIQGAEPGDFLAVHLIDIQPEGEGVACCSTELGQLCHWMTKDHPTNTRFFDLSDNGKIITMRELENKDASLAAASSRRHRVAPIAFPALPMLGVIGVAPDGTEPILTMPAGHHGGNLDNNCHGIGSTIYLPVYHKGALLSLGDMHASQGDGEIGGTGVEIRGHVLLQCQVLSKQSLLLFLECDDTATTTSTTTSTSSIIPQELPRFPVTETDTHWITHGVMVDDIPQSTNLACQEAACLLVTQWGFTPSEAFLFLSTAANLGLCQACHPDKGTQIAKMTVPKLPMCPRPFRVLWEQQQQQDQQQP
jgi:amidase